MVLSSNYWFFDFDATSFHKFFKILLNIFFFCNFDYLSFLLAYSNIDFSSGFGKTFNHRPCSQRKVHYSNVFDTFLHFFTEFFGFCLLFCCFQNHNSYYDVFLIMI